jgi:hypothetical protein
MSEDKGWPLFQVFADPVSAEVACDRLRLEHVPARVETRSLENARETQYCVFVHDSLVHRARWILAQLSFTDEELNYLATGRLPGQDEE